MPSHLDQLHTAATVLEELNDECERRHAEIRNLICAVRAAIHMIQNEQKFHDNGIVPDVIVDGEILIIMARIAKMQHNLKEQGRHSKDNK